MQTSLYCRALGTPVLGARLFRAQQRWRTEQVYHADKVTVFHGISTWPLGWKYLREQYRPLVPNGCVSWVKPKEMIRQRRQLQVTRGRESVHRQYMETRPIEPRVSNQWLNLKVSGSLPTVKNLVCGRFANQFFTSSSRSVLGRVVNVLCKFANFNANREKTSAHFASHKIILTGWSSVFTSLSFLLTKRSGIYCNELQQFWIIMTSATRLYHVVYR